MPVFKATLRRKVSRTVFLDQTASVYIEADDAKQAREAADALRWDEDQIDENCTEWRDDFQSRQANDITEDSKAREVAEVVSCDMPASFAMKAAEILYELADTPDEDDE